MTYITKLMSISCFLPTNDALVKGRISTANELIIKHKFSFDKIFLYEWYSKNSIRDPCIEVVLRNYDYESLTT